MLGNTQQSTTHGRPKAKRIRRSIIHFQQETIKREPDKVFTLHLKSSKRPLIQIREVSPNKVEVSFNTTHTECMRDECWLSLDQLNRIMSYYLDILRKHKKRTRRYASNDSCISSISGHSGYFKDVPLTEVYNLSEMIVMEIKKVTKGCSECEEGRAVAFLPKKRKAA